MSELYRENMNPSFIVNERRIEGYIQLADGFMVEVKTKPFWLHRKMMGLFFGWKWIEGNTRKEKV